MTIKVYKPHDFMMEFDNIYSAWEKYHNKKMCTILLQQLTSDIVFFLGVPLTEELEERIDKLEAEINDY